MTGGASWLLLGCCVWAALARGKGGRGPAGRWVRGAPHSLGCTAAPGSSRPVPPEQSRVPVEGRWASPLIRGAGFMCLPEGLEQAWLGGERRGARSFPDGACPTVQIVPGSRGEGVPRLRLLPVGPGRPIPLRGSSPGRGAGTPRRVAGAGLPRSGAGLPRGAGGGGGTGRAPMQPPFPGGTRLAAPGPARGCLGPRPRWPRPPGKQDPRRCRHQRRAGASPLAPAGKAAGPLASADPHSQSAPTPRSPGSGPGPSPSPGPPATGKEAETSPAAPELSSAASPAPSRTVSAPSPATTLGNATAASATGETAGPGSSTNGTGPAEPSVSRSPGLVAVICLFVSVLAITSALLLARLCCPAEPAFQRLDEVPMGPVAEDSPFARCPPK